MTPPAALARTEEIVRALAGAVPPVTTNSSWPATEVVMVEPAIVAAPAALSCRMPPSAVALAEVTVSAAPSVRLAEAPERRTVFAASAPEVGSGADGCGRCGP